MTQVVTVQTDFADLNQMTEGLMERVHETHVILTGPDAIVEGDWVQFAILLQDGAAGFAGLGRCVRSVDNGEARQAHQRYDLVLDSLQFDQHGQDVFQYILMSRQAMQNPGGAAEAYEAGDDYADGQGYEDVDSDFAESLPADAPVAEEPAYPAAEAYGGEDEPTRMEPAADLAVPAEFEDDHPSEAPMDVSMDVAALDEDHAYGDEADTGAMAAEQTMAAEPPTAADVGEQRFIYTGGLPIPDAPPRPTLDPSLRVTPAPRPLTPSTTPQRPADGIDPYETARAAAAAAPVDDIDDDEVSMVLTEPPPGSEDNGVARAGDEYEADEPLDSRAVEDDSTTSL